MTVIITGGLFARPIMLMFRDSRYLALLNLITSPLRATFAVNSIMFLVILIITSAWRRRLCLTYEVWQVLHAALASRAHRGDRSDPRSADGSYVR